MIQLPDLRQSTDYDCGAVAIDVVCQFYGRRTRGPVRLANPIQGMAPDTVEAFLRSLGFKLLTGTMSVADLKHFTKSGRPVLVCRDGHWVVVRAVGRGLVYYHCPSDGPSKMTITRWEETWNDRTSSGHAYDHYGCAAAP